MTIPQLFNYIQNLVMSPRGAQCQDGLTVSCKVTLALTDFLILLNT